MRVYLSIAKQVWPESGQEYNSRKEVSMNRCIAAFLIVLISTVSAFAADVAVRARKLKKPVQIAYVKQIAHNKWEMRYGPPSNPNEQIYHFSSDKRVLVTEFCEFEFVWK